MADTGTDLDQGTKDGEALGLQIPGEEATELVPYERGVSLREIAKGTIARFLPGSVIGMGILSAIIPPAGLDLARLIELVVVHEVAPLSIGFGLGLFGLHRWLYPDSEVAGRKSFIAGLLTPIAMLGLAVLLRLQPAQASLLVGIAMAVGMFFPWLSPTPGERRPNRYEPDQPDQLPDSSGHTT
jgi:hypothetical protein